ncbi:MAG: SemiSWEET family sugar transporter [Candidatus Brocadiales bacterium]
MGIVAAACCTGGLVPQLVRGIRTKSLNDVSPWLLGMLILGTTLWFLYGLHLEDKIIMGANAISFVMACAILYLRTKYQVVREEHISTIKKALEHSET